MQLGNWQLDTVSGGTFRLDGGVMFGIVPQRLWKPLAPPDELNRVLVANNCILARDGRHTVLIDCGYGGKYAPLDRNFYAMEEGEPLVASLERLGVAGDDIDIVVFSHLHFDHVCGATRRDAQRALQPVFARARYVVGAMEWEDATQQAPELESAYPLADILALEETGRLTLIGDQQEVVPGLTTWVTGGHTRGHLALVFRSAGETAIYPGDICPSTLHLRRMWHMAYDVYPLETRRRKPHLLGQAAEGHWWVLWNHDPQVAISRVARHPKREFVAVDATPPARSPGHKLG